MGPFPQTLLECVAAPRSDRVPAQAQRNQLGPAPFVAKVRSRGPPGGVTCAASALHPAGRRERPRAATPCPNTKAGQAKQVRTSPDEDQKTDGELLLERPSRPGHTLQTCLATRDQQWLHRPCGEEFRSELERS